MCGGSSSFSLYIVYYEGSTYTTSPTATTTDTTTTTTSTTTITTTDDQGDDTGGLGGDESYDGERNSSVLFRIVPSQGSLGVSSVSDKPLCRGS